MDNMVWICNADCNEDKWYTSPTGTQPYLRETLIEINLVFGIKYQVFGIWS